MCVMISVRGSALVSSMVREMSDCPSVKQITRIPAILGGKLCNRSLGYCAIFLLYLGFVFLSWSSQCGYEAVGLLLTCVYLYLHLTVSWTKR